MCSLRLSCLLLVLCLHTISLIDRQYAAEPYSLVVVTDRDDAVYDVGDEATFLITVKRGDQPVAQLLAPITLVPYAHTVLVVEGNT